MGAITAQILRKFVEVSRCPEAPEVLLERAGLTLDSDTSAAARQVVSADVYYDLLELCYGTGDGELPFRYGAAVRPEDFGVFGLALKTASSVGEALERLVRYILVVTDTLEYQLLDEKSGRRFVLQGRPSDERHGVRLANEGALAAVSSLLRQVVAAPISPALVSFRHSRPPDTAPHEAFFGCPVRFGAGLDALHFSQQVLASATRLADEGLSSFLLTHLDQLRERSSERSMVLLVREVVTDTLCDGVPSKAQVARRLGLSERTLQRRLGEQGRKFQEVVSQVRREVAEALLTTTKSSLSEVAFLTGFSDQSSFQRAFKSWTGQTPLAFRQAAL